MNKQPETGDSASPGHSPASRRTPGGGEASSAGPGRDATGPADAIHAPDTLAGQDVSHAPFRAMPMDIEAFRQLAEFALDLRWSWKPNEDWVWRRIDPVLWDLTHNPWAVLGAASRARIEHLCTDAEFHGKLAELRRIQQERRDKPVWFPRAHGHGALHCVAYFSMEFMLGEALPIYSGGLGNVAGDQLKAASDLGVPVVGVGLLYQQGYFRQVIDHDGAQQAMYPYNDPGQLPIRPLRGRDGQWLRLQLQLPGHAIWLRAWQVKVGRVRLYLLDSNDVANYPAYRGITSELYGGGPYLRLMQEIVLGIGGWRLLTTLGLTPEVCHLNEGHAAFAVLERARSFMLATGKPFDVALAATRPGNLFTTHTAVSAGFDRFAPELVAATLSGYANDDLGISTDELLALGRQNPQDPAESFNMAYLAIRGSGAVNGVSRLHEVVSRQLFQSLFARWPHEEVPVGHVTNGVHTPTWNAADADELWSQRCGSERFQPGTEASDQRIRSAPDADLWKFRSAARRRLVDYARERLSRELTAAGAAPAEVEDAKRIFDPDVLTLGFARRFATYKRPNLLLHDPQRLLRILTDAQRPVQLIIAGKAHPADQPGQALIRQWIQFIRNGPGRRHVIFLSDYDMLLTERLVQGADVWLNTPRRPWEASGTSGMKVLVNGGVNLSELDGWWAEAYTPQVGWALGDGREHGDDPRWDEAEAEQLYQLLEREVIPEFYSRDADGIPAAWVRRIKESMAQLTGKFSASRTVREYTDNFYVPAASAYAARSADGAAMAERIAAWQKDVTRSWAGVRITNVKLSTDGGHHHFEVQVYLDGLDADGVAVEIYAEGLAGGAPVRQEMRRLRQLVGSGHAFAYGAEVSASRPASQYTVRAVPRFAGVSVPLESPEILWQH